MNLFGKKKKAPPKLNESIQSLRESIQMLDKREKHLEKQIQQTLEEAKAKAKAKDKRGALFHLKRKKLLEKQIDQIYGKKINIETQVMALESAASNKDVLNVMRQGKEALQSTIQENDIDKVDEVIADINDAVALADELGDAISRPIGGQIDDDELNAELEQMESQLYESEMLEAPKVPVVRQDANKIVASLPAAPSRELAQPESEKDIEENQLKELEAIMQ